ncbi:ISAs1 family transposase [Streptomyces zinciresistens]|uniref:ISAs1 family transposase n=1 Tax=Streptomyces zinciresistens TaxID=1073330 RepID=UPI00244D62BD|nr:ISAs1 family transposase [Streptomyces zinciresistens]
MPLREVTAKFYDRTEGHGRKETRVVQVLTVDDLDFPHAAQVTQVTQVAQVAQVVRHRTCLKTGRRSRETVYVITVMTSREASPQRLAKIIRSQWVIENRLHFVRDTAFREDASKVHTEHRPSRSPTSAASPSVQGRRRAATLSPASTQTPRN